MLYKSFLTLLFSLHVLKSQKLFSDYPEIIGDNDFQQKVFDALKLLENKNEETLDFVKLYIGRIEQYSKTAMCAYCRPPTYQVGEITADSGSYWLAGTIAHDAYHSYLYHQYHAENAGRRPPHKAWAGIEAERQCNQYQMDVLFKIGAPEYMIKYMSVQTGTHCDLNGDGICDINDYNLRNWRH